MSFIVYFINEIMFLLCNYFASPFNSTKTYFHLFNFYEKNYINYEANCINNNTHYHFQL